MKEIFDFNFYCNWLKIKTKTQGLQKLRLRKVQKRFISFIDELRDQGPVRIITLKPRQAGWSTIIAAYLYHHTATREDFKGIVIADKLGRTRALQAIYSEYLNSSPPQVAPMVSKNNTEDLYFDDPRSPGYGLRSGITFGTALDPSVGRSTSRQWAHLSECAFYRSANYLGIDEGIQNSIPLAMNTFIIKESTANGKSGDGKHFFDLWQAASRGGSIFKTFFVPWWEVDDYAFPIPDGFKLTKDEKDRMKQFPEITPENIVWWRMKLMEYQTDGDNAIITPTDRMQADFPDTAESAFIATGQPVFDAMQMNRIVNSLRNNMQKDIKDRLKIDDMLIKNHWRGLKIFEAPRQTSEYFIGADVSEGLATGDASTFCVINQDGVECASWYGKIHPEEFGDLLSAVGHIFHTAYITPECNNMGHTTVVRLRNLGYPKLYKTITEDAITRKKSERYGWMTTRTSKNDMLNEIGAKLEKELHIRDIYTAEEMASLAREENGDCKLNSKDRTVALGLAAMGRRHYYSNKPIKLEYKKEYYDTQLLRKSKRGGVDVFG